MPKRHPPQSDIDKMTREINFTPSAIIGNFVVDRSAFQILSDIIHIQISAINRTMLLKTIEIRTAIAEQVVYGVQLWTCNIEVDFPDHDYCFG